MLITGFAITSTKWSPKYGCSRGEVYRAEKNSLRHIITVLEIVHHRYNARCEARYKALLYNWEYQTPGRWTDGIDSEQYQKQERDHRRKLDVADLLFDTLGIPEPGLADISHIIHVLKCLLLQLLFRSFSIFPGTVRPRCTTMPWSIWPALVVLWGVCWMFYPPRPDKQSEHRRTLHSEIGNSQQGEFEISYVLMCRDQ